MFAPTMVPNKYMKPADYIRNAIKTETRKYTFGATGAVTPRIEHAVYGIATEAGELMDALKQSKIYGKGLDKTNLVEEVGDVMWYLALLCDELEITFEEVWDKNIRKLKARYPEKFSKKNAAKRNLEKERQELEK